MACGTREENKRGGRKRRGRVIQYVLGSEVVGGAVGENRGEREKGGWAARCPTEGGTDEVKEKWRERRREELRKRPNKG